MYQCIVCDISMNKYHNHYMFLHCAIQQVSQGEGGPAPRSPRTPHPSYHLATFARFSKSSRCHIFFKIAPQTTNPHYKRSSKLKKILCSRFFAIVQDVSSAPPREVCTCSTMFCMLDFSTKSDPHYKPKRKMKRKEYGNVLHTTKHSRCTYYELNQNPGCYTLKCTWE